MRVVPGMTVSTRMLLVSTSSLSAQGPTRWARAPAPPKAAPPGGASQGWRPRGGLVGNSITGEEDGETLVEGTLPTARPSQCSATKSPAANGC